LKRDRRKGQGALAALGLLGLLIPFFGGLWFHRLSEQEDEVDRQIYRLAVLDWKSRIEVLARDPQTLREGFAFNEDESFLQYPHLTPCPAGLKCPVQMTAKPIAETTSWELRFRSVDLSRTNGPLLSKESEFRVTGDPAAAAVIVSYPRLECPEGMDFELARFSPLRGKCL
jgi:hypothetical protein